jgi:hypothetical protein
MECARVLLQNGRSSSKGAQFMGQMFRKWNDGFLKTPVVDDDPAAPPLECYFPDWMSLETF